MYGGCVLSPHGLLGTAILKIPFDILSIPVALFIFAPFSNLRTLEASTLFKLKLESFLVKNYVGVMLSSLN